MNVRVRYALLLLHLALVQALWHCPRAAALKADTLELSGTLSLESAHRVKAPEAAPSAEQRLMISTPISVDLKELTGLRLGTLSAQGMAIKEGLSEGRRPLLNDEHAYSNLRAEDRLQLFELFWERSWSQLTARVGKLDANDHFAVSEHESLLINGASGYSPSIYGMPSYPDSAWSAQLSYQLERVDLSAAVFDGGSTTLKSTPTGARLWLSPSARSGGLFWVAQLTAHLGRLHSEEALSAPSALTSPQQDRDFTARAPVYITLGAWTHRGDLYQPSDPSASALSSSGLYLTSDISLADMPHGGELGLGLQAALGQHSYPLHLSAALTWTSITAPLAWASVGPNLAFGASVLSRSAELESLDLDEKEELIELTTTLPLSGSLATSLSLMTIAGAQLSGERANLVIARLILGVQ